MNQVLTGRGAIHGVTESNSGRFPGVVNGLLPGVLPQKAAGIEEFVVLPPRTAPNNLSGAVFGDDTL